MRGQIEPTPYADINAVLRGLLAQLNALFGAQLQGMYLIGSLALGDFDPRISDIDYIVVTTGEFDESLFRQLQIMHTEVAAGGASWANKIEAVYVSQTTLHRARPTATPYPQIEKGVGLFSAPLEHGWVFQCYTLREYGVTITGPDPRTLLDPIDPSAMRPAVAAITGEWLQQSRHDPDWLAWLRQPDHQRFVIQTLCRMVYSLATGGVTSKPKATYWAQTTLPAPWPPLIAHSFDRSASAAVSPDQIGVTLDLIRWTWECSRDGD